jgi:hypothetical protein
MSVDRQSGHCLGPIHELGPITRCLRLALGDIWRPQRPARRRDRQIAERPPCHIKPSLQCRLLAPTCRCSRRMSASGGRTDMSFRMSRFCFLTLSLRTESGVRLGMVRRPDGRARPLDAGMGGRRTYFRFRPLNELCRSRPSDVMSRYSMSAKKVGSTHVAFGFLIGFVSLDFGLTTVSSCFLI